MSEEYALHLSDLTLELVENEIELDRRCFNNIVSPSGIEYQVLITLNPSSIYGVYINRVDNILLRSFQHLTSIEKCLEYVDRVCL